MTEKPPSSSSPASHIAVFQETAIRRVWHNEEWWFSVVDVCAILTESLDAGLTGANSNSGLMRRAANP